MFNKGRHRLHGQTKVLKINFDRGLTTTPIPNLTLPYLRKTVDGLRPIRHSKREL